MTTVKILNNGKIHKLSQLPQTFSSLQDSIKLILQDTLPNSYILQYEDLEGDHVMLASEEDYAAMLLTELPKDLSKSLRIHVVSRDRPETGYNKDPTYCGMQEFVQSDNKDIHEQIQEGNNTQNLNAKPHLKAANNDEMLDSSDEEEKDDRSRSDFDHHGKDKKHKYGDFDKDEMKKQKKVMKKEIKAHRMAKKTELLKDAITEALFDNLPTIAKVVKAYVDDPTMNLEETVQNARPKTTLGSQLEDAESLQGHFKRPFLMFRSLIDVYRGLTDEQKTETNKLLGGIPEKLLTGDHEKTKEGGPWGGPGGPWGGHGGHWGPPGHPWGGPGGPWGGPGGPWGGPWGHRHRRGGDWNSEQSEEQQQEGKWRHKHHHHHHGGPPRMDEKNEKNEKYEKYNKYDKHDKHDKYDKYEKKDKKDKFEGQEGWKKKDREGGNEEKKRDKKDWRTKEEENVGSEFSMELVKEVGTVPPKVSVSDGTIYKTVIIKNTGAVEWPRSALLVPRGEIRGENVRLTNVKPGQEYTPVLVMKGTGKVGTFVTKWKLAYKDEQGKNYFTGASIDVGVDVLADS